MNFVVYDFETTGRNPTWDQIIQVGAILIDKNFNEIDQFQARCSLKPGLIPHPGALLVNQTTISMLNETNLSHYELIVQMLEKFSQWSPAIFIGYNSINFDEEFLRKTLFKVLKQPYFTQLEGNKRADALNLVRSSYLYYPDCINVPINEKGNNTFKLELLTKHNDIKHFAHDAMGDVLATIEIIKILQQKSQAVWKSWLISSSKYETEKIIKNEKIFCYDEYLYGKSRPYVLTYLFDHPEYNYPQCYDLKFDPTDYLELPYNELSKIFKQSPKIIRSLKTNKSPILMNFKNTNESIVSKNYENLEKLDQYNKIGFEELNKRAKIIENNQEFKDKILSIINDEVEDRKYTSSQLDFLPEESIYKGGFPSNKDRNLMDEFHHSDWQKRFSISNKFEDQRYYYFGMRLIYEEAPKVLPKQIYNEIHRSITSQLLSMNKEKWNTIPMAYKELDDLKVKFEDKEDTKIINQLFEIDNYLQTLEKFYQNT